MISIVILVWTALTLIGPYTLSHPSCQYYRNYKKAQFEWVKSLFAIKMLCTELIVNVCVCIYEQNIIRVLTLEHPWGGGSN